MIGGTVFGALEILRVRGSVGFAAHQGFPFKWYWNRDISTQYDPGYGYIWSGLVFDIVIWSVAVVVMGSFIELILQRFTRKHESKRTT